MGFAKNITPENVRTQLQELKFPVAHCNRHHSFRSGKPLKHLLVMMEQPTMAMFDLTGLCGKRIKVEAYQPHMKRNQSPQAVKKDSSKPFNGREKEALRNFESFFRRLFQVCKTAGDLG